MSVTGQTSVSYAPGYQREGMRGRSNNVNGEQVFSRVAEAAIKAGRFVIGGTDPLTQCTNVANSTDIPGKLLGVAMWDPGMEPASPEYAAGAMVSILRKGIVWMKAEDAVAFGASPYVRYTAGSSEVGRVRSDGDSSKAAALTSARFLNATSGSDGWVEVEINIP